MGNTQSGDQVTSIVYAPSIFGGVVIFPTGATSSADRKRDSELSDKQAAERASRQQAEAEAKTRA